MPQTITLHEATGFGLFLLKAMINGRGDELIDPRKGESASPVALQLADPELLAWI